MKRNNFFNLKVSQLIHLLLMEPCKQINIYQGAVIPYSGNTTYSMIGINPPYGGVNTFIDRDEVNKTNNFIFQAELEIKDMAVLGKSLCYSLIDPKTGFIYYARDVDIIKKMVHGKVFGNWTFYNDKTKYYIMFAS